MKDKQVLLSRATAGLGVDVTPIVLKVLLLQFLTANLKI